MRDIAGFGVRRDNDQRNARSQSSSINDRWNHVIVEAPPLIPRNKYGGTTPILAVHHSIYLLCDPVLTGLQGCRRMVTLVKRRDYPGDIGHFIILDICNKLAGVMH